MADAILPQENGIPVDTGELNDLHLHDANPFITQWSMKTARQIEVNGAVPVETGTPRPLPLVRNTILIQDPRMQDSGATVHSDSQPNDVNWSCFVTK